MLRSLWISKTGMDAQQMNLDVITNNLSNSSTTAFKRVQPMFQDLLYTTLRAVAGVCNNDGRSALAQAPNSPAQTLANIRCSIVRLKIAIVMSLNY